MPRAPGRALSAATAALALGGCGIEVVPAEHDQQHARTPAAPLRAPRPARGQGACPRGAADSLCPRGAQRVIVASRTHTLELEELTVRLIRQTVRSTLPATRARLADSDYTFVLLRLDVLNKLPRPARFGRSVGVGRQPQVMLRLGGRWYPEYPEAERGVRDGFARRLRSISPGELRTGDVAFAVPRAPGRRLARAGNALGVVGFGEVGGPLRPRTLGLIPLGPER